MTPEQRLLCADPNWRLDHFYKIKTKKKTIETFTKNKIQNILHRDSTRYDIILKARQVGISTYCILKLLDKTMFTRNFTGGIMSHDQKSMEKLFSIVRRAHKLMDPRIKPIIEKGGGSKYELKFPEIDSKIYCTMEAVSDTVNGLHVSEMALMKNDSRVSTSLDAVPLDDGFISIETTARGFNHFYDFYMDDETLYKRFFFPWYFHEEYSIPSGPLELTDDEQELVKKAKKLYKHILTFDQIAFRRAKIKQKKNKLKEFLQEFPEDDQTCFLSSGDKVFDGTIIQQLKLKCKPVLKTESGIRIYVPYDRSRRYVIGADVAEGVASDYSVAKVLDIKSLEEVASFRANKIKPGDFGDKLIIMGNMYHTGGRPKPLIGVERNNHGHAVLLKLQTEGYENIFVHENIDERPGWLTNKVTRPMMLDAYIDAVESGTTKVNDKVELDECLTLVDNDGKIEAEETKHDDTIIAKSIALQLAIHHDKSALFDNIDDYLRI